MRNGQNNKNRLRNRNSHGGSGHNNHNNNNNNRRSQNPLTRVFESNGPDIKIRGTASHIAEKYVQLARDARTSGDPVASENYYQHAEHYFRLIAAAQEQFRQSQPQPRDGDPAPANAEEAGDEEGENFSHFGAEPGFVPMQQQPREQNFQTRENNYQPREHQPREHRPREHQSQPNFQPAQPAAPAGDADLGGLPSFITGGQPTAPAPFEGPAADGAPRERFPRRRRRPNGPRPDAAQPVPAGDDA